MRILITDGSRRVRETLIRYLGLDQIFEMVFEASTVKEAIRIMQSIKIEVVLLDIQLHDESGLELANFCKTQSHKPVVIICSNYGMPNYINVYEKLSIDHFFDKSSEMLELKKFIRKLTKDRKNNLTSLSTNVSPYH